MREGEGRRGQLQQDRSAQVCRLDVAVDDLRVRVQVNLPRGNGEVRGEIVSYITGDARGGKSEAHVCV